MSGIDINNYEAFLLDYLEGNLNERDLNDLKAFAVLHPELNIDLGNNQLPYFLKEELSTDFKINLFKTEENLPDERVIAYVEGKLSETEKQKFENEIQSDKSLAAELKLYSKSILQADQGIVLDTKNLLIKNEDELLLNNLSLLCVEGLLEGDEKTAFEGELKSNSTLKRELELFKKAKLIFDDKILYPDKENLKKENKVILLYSTRSIVSIAAAILLIVGLAVLFNNFNSNPLIKKQISSKSNGLSKNEIKKQLNSHSIISKPNIEKFVPEKIYEASKNQTNRGTLKQYKDTLPLIEKIDVNKNVVKVEKMPEEIINPTLIRNDTAIVSNKVKEENNVLPDNPNYVKQNILLAYEEDEEIMEEENQKKPGFWKRAARLAKQANGLGMKAINGEEKSGDKFMLSFNSFSIEKK